MGDTSQTLKPHEPRTFRSMLFTKPIIDSNNNLLPSSQNIKRSIEIEKYYNDFHQWTHLNNQELQASYESDLTTKI